MRKPRPAEPEKPLPPSTPAQVILARAPAVAELREHRKTHPTAAESNRERWEAEQARRFGCKYIDVDGVGVCLTHGSAPPPKERP